MHEGHGFKTRPLIEVMASKLDLIYSLKNLIGRLSSYTKTSDRLSNQPYSSK